MVCILYMVCWFRTCVDLFRLDFELWVVGWGGLSKNIGLTIVKSKDCTWDFWTTHTYEKCIILSNIITRWSLTFDNLNKSFQSLYRLLIPDVLDLIKCSINFLFANAQYMLKENIYIHFGLCMKEIYLTKSCLEYLNFGWRVVLNWEDLWTIKLLWFLCCLQMRWQIVFKLEVCQVYHV